MARDSQRYRKTYSYYRVQPKTELLEVIADESLDWKRSVRVASTSSVSLTGSTPLVVDGKTLAVDERVLLKDQGTASQNGIYYVEITGGSYTLTRDTDAVQGTLTCGAATYVEEGTSSEGKIYILSTINPITVGSTNLVWTEFASGGGGSSPEYGQFYTEAQQYAGAINTPQEVTWETKSFGSSGITCNGSVGSPDSVIDIQNAGVYSVKVRTHGVQTVGGSLVLYVWCNLDGNDVDGTMTVWQIPYATVPNRQCVSTEWMIDVPGTSELKIMWATDNIGLSLADQNFSGVASRAVTVEINKVS